MQLGKGNPNIFYSNASSFVDPPEADTADKKAQRGYKNISGTRKRDTDMQ